MVKTERIAKEEEKRCQRMPVSGKAEVILGSLGGR